MQSGCEPRACPTRVMWYRALFIPSEGETVFRAGGAAAFCASLWIHVDRVVDKFVASVATSNGTARPLVTELHRPWNMFS